MNVSGLVFVTLVGSLRQNSPVIAIAHTLDELAPDDVQVDLLGSVGEFPHYVEDDQIVSLPNEVAAMGLAVCKADGLVIVTPEHNRSVPATLKNALDWLGTCPERPLSRKPVALQTASLGMSGGVRAQEHLRQMLSSLDAVVLNQPEIAIPQIATKIDPAASTLRDDQARHDIAMQLKVFAMFARDTNRSLDPVFRPSSRC